MKAKLQRAGAFAALIAALLASSYPAQAWYKHQALMAMVLSGPQLEQASVLRAPIPPSCGQDYAKIAGQVAQNLQLNSAIETAPSPFAAACNEQRNLTGAEILAGPSIDEPDESGMDENLPPETDPAGDRPWMGGLTGPSSKGFRHMYYAGWTPFQPIASFQTPMHAIGVAPERAALIGVRAREALHRGAPFEAWGFRMLAWSLHYLQDLTQPFHSSQDLTPLMLPWETLFGRPQGPWQWHLPWPSTESRERFRQETDRIVTNYHWALEGYVLERAKEGVDSPWNECLANPSRYWTIPENIAGSSNDRMAQLRATARGLARVSRDQAVELGGRAIRFFGRDLMTPGASMPGHSVKVDYGALSIRPDLDRERHDLHETVCQSLANTAWVTGWLVKWAFQP